MDIHVFTHPVHGACRFTGANVAHANLKLSEHRCAIWSTGRRNEDNWGIIQIEKTKRIIDKIRENIDGNWMIWADMDIVIPSNLTPMFEMMTNTSRELLLSVLPIDGKLMPIYPFQVIRRTINSLVFYSRVIMLQKMTEDKNFNDWATEILLSDEGLKWAALPEDFGSWRKITL